MEKTIKVISKRLETSPLFQLSLGSKELFHGNFIYWIAKKYPDQSARVLGQFLNKKDATFSLKEIRREQKNIDLHFYFTDGQELIIENKVKSIPYLEQLEKYSDNALENQSFILLTLTKPSFSRGSSVTLANGVSWKVISYADLAKLLESIIGDISDTYDSHLIKDYISFISILDKIMGDIEVSENDPFDFHVLEEGGTLKTLQGLRMHDVYLKIKYQSLAMLTYEKLKKIFPGKRIYLDVGSKEKKQVGNIYIGHGMTRSQGFIEVACVVQEGLFLTTQIQGNLYRQMVQGYAGYGKAAKQYAEQIKEKGQWFNFKHIFKNPEEYPKSSTKVFNKYSETDFYRSVQINPGFTLG
jgi:hypothetical protein